MSTCDCKASVRLLLWAGDCCVDGSSDGEAQLLLAYEAHDPSAGVDGGEAAEFTHELEELSGNLEPPGTQHEDARVRR